MKRLAGAAAVVLASLVASLGIYPMVQANSVQPCNTDIESAHEVVTASGTYLDCDWSVA